MYQIFEYQFRKKHDIQTLIIVSHFLKCGDVVHRYDIIINNYVKTTATFPLGCQ